MVEGHVAPTIGRGSDQKVGRLPGVKVRGITIVLIPSASVGSRERAGEGGLPNGRQRRRRVVVGAMLGLVTQSDGLEKLQNNLLRS